MHNRKKLPADELIAEVIWLADGGMHPEHIAEALGRSLTGIERILRNHGHTDLSNRFDVAYKRIRAGAA